ncbi:MBL fold metallo-hydrolase [Akkermansiaceae bacterium]|nr:MBL fold metallo-hydrolase [Akkermansiaceae bacterium]
MLEDELEDILGKACRAKAIPYSSLPSTLEEIAIRLELSSSALKNLSNSFSEPELAEEVTKITTSFGHLGVNCFFVQTPMKSYLIDTGTQWSKVQHLLPDFVLVTHDHHDHTQFSDRFNVKPFYPGSHTDLLDEKIMTFDVSGHCTPSLAYYFPYLSKPTCFVGDAIFKRSMGGCHTLSAYNDALSKVGNLLNTLPDETILCVGHGPCTTVKLEKKENPFFAKQR